MCQLTIFKSPHLVRYIYYCVLFLLFGFVLIGIGPMIPYYAAKQHHAQPQYSVIFLGRSLGCIVGSLFIKFFGERFTIHQYIIIGLVFIGIFHIPFNYIQIIWLKTIFYFFGSFGLVIVDIIASHAIMEGFKNQEYEDYLQFGYGFLGLGGLIVPGIVYLINYQTYLALAIFAFLLIPLGLFLQSPEIYNQEHGIVKEQQNKQTGLKQFPVISNKLMILLSLSMLFVLTVQGIFNTWISSYAVMSHFNTKQSATMYNSIFWFTNTIFRFVYVFIGGKHSTRLSVVTIIGFFCSIGVIAIIYGGYPHIGLIFISFIIGICEGSLLTSNFALAREYGYSLVGDKITIFMLFGFLGSGIFSFITGKLMAFLPKQILFIILAFVFFVLFTMNMITKAIMEYRGQNDNQFMQEEAQ